MHRSTLFLLYLGLASAVFASGVAHAAVWSVEADCKRGEWFVEVELAGFGPVDASCADGGETRLSIDVGERIVTGGYIATISSRGTVCEGPQASDSKFGLKCGSETEDATGFEVEEELEVEVELEEPDEVEVIESEDD